MLNFHKILFSIGKQFQDTKAAVTRIIDIQTMQTEQFGKKALDVVSSIEIQNLSVSLGGKTIIKDFNAVFQSGKMYGIIGDNGAGKTTLINVLSGLYRDCYSGNLLFDGIPLSNFSEHYLHMDLISVCTQESSLINTTILENILLGAGYQEKIVEVIRAY